MAQEENDPALLNEGTDVHVLTVPRRIAETVVLVCVLAVAVAFLWGARDIRNLSGDLTGAQSFPTALSLILIGITAIMIVAALRLPPEQTITIKRPRGLLVAMALLLAFPALVEVLGYYILILPWLLAFGWAARVRSPFLIAITILTVLFVARVVFQMILGTPMP